MKPEGTQTVLAHYIQWQTTVHVYRQWYITAQTYIQMVSGEDIMFVTTFTYDSICFDLF